METNRPSPQGLVSQDDGGPVMKTDHTESVMVPCGDEHQDQDETRVIPPGPALITRYYSVMDDEGADDVFIPPPPTYLAPLLPAEGSTDTQVNNSHLTLTNRAADATQAKANPSGLDWHHGEKQLMAAQNEVDEVIAQASEESIDTVSLSKDKDCTLRTDQDQTFMEECYDPSGRCHKNTSGDGESDEEPEDIRVLSEGQEKCRETEVKKDKYPKQEDSSLEENPETDSKLTTDADCDNMEAKASTECSAQSCRPPELCKCNQNTMEPEVSSEDEEHVETNSLNYTKCNWARRESGTGETQASRLSTSEGSEEEQGDGNKRIATNIQQGEQLLQRLQLVQLRQDEGLPESPPASQMDVQETRGETKGVFGTEVVDESKDVEEKARMSLSTMPEESEDHAVAKIEAGDSNDDQTKCCVSTDLSPIDPHETLSAQIPLLSTCHRHSVAETCKEKQIHEEAEGKQNLQRAGGVFNLADNPDVLEIPFKTNISLEPLPAEDGPDQGWQFSERKMKKEISQEIQRELVLVNQGKIPGGYSKGEVRQIKETKLLFEAFQQDNTEGPTRHRKPPTFLKKGRIYPSVLERTRSLEMLSLKSCPVPRAHSLRLFKDTEKSPEILRSTSPNGGSRDKTRLSPYLKPDKQARLCRSMDSINTEASAKSAVDPRGKNREGSTTQESPILKRNPFFKLRPALALQPEVEKDIREAKEREEELRRQRCTLYGEKRRSSEDGEMSRSKPVVVPDVRKQSTGKLELVWPPPSKKDQMRSEQTQEAKVHRTGGQKASLWQRWESGLINGKPSKEKN